MFQNADQAIGWLAGVIDGEGHVSKRVHSRGGSRSFSRSVSITNTDMGMIETAEQVLSDLGVRFKRYDRSERERLGTKPIFDIVVTGKENLDILQVILPLQTFKREKLHELTTSYVRKNRPPREELEEYLAYGRPDSWIAEQYSVTAAAVWAWRKYYGLESAKARFKKFGPTIVIAPNEERKT